MAAPALVRKFMSLARAEGPVSALRSVRFWLQRRAEARNPTRGQPLGAGHSCRIDEFIYFRGQLWLAGQVSVAPQRIARLRLHVPGAETQGVRFTRREDGHASFNVRLQTFGTTLDAAAATLRIETDDRMTYVIGDLGLPHADPAHEVMERFLRELRARSRGALLDIGARARSGVARRDLAPPGWTYEGLDILPGANVDTVGDAHELSKHYPPESFDAVISVSVLEHLLMPWKVVLELNRVLKPGAIGIFATHQSWPLHDQPWDFWRFSNAAWPALLNPATGFEIIDAQMGEPAHVIAGKLHPATAFSPSPAGALASFVMFRKIANTDLSWPVDLAASISTGYPSATAEVS